MALALAFPKALLGVMLLFSGLALAEAARKAEDISVLLLTTAGCMALGYLPGVLMGWAATFLLPKKELAVP